MLEVPQDRKYTNHHDWIRIDGEVAIIGITDYAQDSLGDVVYIETQSAVGSDVVAKEQGVLLESNKAVSDIFWPLDGKIIEINQELIDNPEIVNSDPYNSGWIVKISIKNIKDLDQLMSPEEYTELLQQLNG